MSWPLPRKSLIRLSGHDPAAVGEDGRDAQHRSALQGRAVLTAMFFTAGSWGVAGWSLGGGGMPGVVGACVGAATGALVVATIDPSLLFAADTGAGAAARRLGFLGRASLSLLMGLVSSQAVMPLLLGPELRAEAFRMREAAEAERLGSYRTRFNLPELNRAVEEDTKRVAAAEGAARSVPPAVAKARKQAATCWAALSRLRRQLVAGGTTTDAARNETASRQGRCNTLKAMAQAIEDDHRRRTGTVLGAAREKLAESTAAATTAAATAASRIATAAAEDAGSIVPASATVLRSLLTRDPSALAKWAALLLMMMTIEVWPLIAKALMGRSATGARLGADLAAEIARHDDRREAAEQVRASAALMRRELARGIEEAIRSDDFQGHLDVLLRRNAVLLADCEMTRAQIADIVRTAREANEAATANRDAAAAITSALTGLTEDVRTVLRRGGIPANNDAANNDAANSDTGDCNPRRGGPADAAHGAAVPSVVDRSRIHPAE